MSMQTSWLTSLLTPSHRSTSGVNMRRLLFVSFVAAAALAGLQGQQSQLKLPLKSNSVRFAVIGDMGTGKKPQFDVAAQMVKYRESFPFEFVITMGDNI